MVVEPGTSRRGSSLRGLASLAALAVLLAACGSSGSSSGEGASSDGGAREDVASESSTSSTAASLTGAEAACDSSFGQGWTANAVDEFRTQVVTDAQDRTYERSTVRRIYNCTDHAVTGLTLTEEEGWLDVEYVKCGSDTDCAPRVPGYWKDGQNADAFNTASVTHTVGTPTCCDEGQYFDWFGHGAAPDYAGIEGHFQGQIADGEGTTYTISGAWENRPYRDSEESCDVTLKDDKFQVFACELVQTDGDNNTVQYLIYQTDT